MSANSVSMVDEAAFTGLAERHRRARDRGASTVISLLCLHVLAAAVMIPALVRSLRLAFDGAHRSPHPLLGQ